MHVVTAACSGAWIFKFSNSTDFLSDTTTEWWVGGYTKTIVKLVVRSSSGMQCGNLHRTQEYLNVTFSCADLI